MKKDKVLPQCAYVLKRECGEQVGKTDPGIDKSHAE